MIKSLIKQLVKGLSTKEASLEITATPETIDQMDAEMPEQKAVWWVCKSSDMVT